MRPLLPDTDALTPYLRRIDSHRWYSNFGPLSRELESRLAAGWDVDADCVLTLSNATQGLSVTLMAAQAARGSLCLMPSWSFVATAHAAVQAGLVPFLVDVDEDSAALTPRLAERALAQAPAPVGAVMPVCPFGAPIAWDEWRDFQDRTGIPVVIDAAAAFDSLRPGPVPAVVSLHATKVLAAGEGAVMICTDPAFSAQVRRHANFGFLGNHSSQVAATNAKMSEYHAAVALAALDLWPFNRPLWRQALGRVRAASQAAGLPYWPKGLGTDYVCSSPAIRVANARHLVDGLNQDGIEARLWWQGGIASHPAFAGCPRLPLPITQHLAATTLALPCWLDLDAETADRLGTSLKRHAQPG